MQSRYFPALKQSYTSIADLTPPADLYWVVLNASIEIAEDATTTGTRHITMLVKDVTSNLPGLVLAFAADDLTAAGSGTNYIYGTGGPVDVYTFYNSTGWVYDGVGPVAHGSGSGLTSYGARLPTVFPGQSIHFDISLAGSDVVWYFVRLLEMTEQEFYEKMVKL